MIDEKARILVIDDEKNCLRAIRDMFEIENLPCATADSVQRGLEYLEHHDFDIILSDVKMPGLSGMEMLKQLKQRKPDVYVILMTGYGSIEDAVRAMKLGAYQYIMKPVIIRDLIDHIRDIFSRIDGSPVYSPFKNMADALPEGKVILGNSERINNIEKLISKIANTDLPVLIVGESGTGKELAATAIHFASERVDNHFVAINCAAFPDTLLESELFGYEKGAFTDAKSQKSGKLAQADKGTLFLDEIGEMKPSMQAKLLRFLEEKEFSPLGSTKSKKVDIRIIAATNKDLSESMKDGSFRQDLYYRLDAVTISMPPLREIVEDIPILANHFANEFADRFNHKSITIPPEIMEILKSYSWPGNVRELANTIRRAVALSDDEQLNRYDFPSHIFSTDSQHESKDTKNRSSLLLSDIEKSHILHVLDLAENNKSQAAQILGIHRDTLLRKLKKYGMG